MKIGFTPRQVMRLTGVPYSTLNLWAKNGLLQPSIATGTGSGSERVYSFSDLIALKVAFELRKAGVTTRSLRAVIKFVRDTEGIENPLAEARLVVSGRDVILVKNHEELVSVLSKPGQNCLRFVVDLPQTLGELIEVADSTNTFAMAFSHAKGVDEVSRKRPVSTSVAHKPKRRHG
jgi:DNA-binding transcriptional MerR regulator